MKLFDCDHASKRNQGRNGPLNDERVIVDCNVTMLIKFRNLLSNLLLTHCLLLNGDYNPSFE